MHWIIDDEVIRAKFVDDVRIGLSPEFREVFRDDLEILCFFGCVHCERFRRVSDMIQSRRAKERGLR